MNNYGVGSVRTAYRSFVPSAGTPKREISHERLGVGWLRFTRSYRRRYFQY